MKKYSVFMLSVLSVVAGCTMEEVLIQDEKDNQKNDNEITIRATREDDPESRTVLESDGSVWWTPGDAISLFYGSGTDGGSKFTSNATENSKVTNFTGVITAITGGGEISVDATYFWGVYPYSEDVSCDGSSITMTLPSKQTAVPGTFATNTFPSMGRSQGLIMGFYNVCGGWRFSVTKEGVRKVTLKSNNGELITGKVKVGFDDSGIPEVREILDGSDEVVLECPAGEYFEVGKNYYMILLPTTFSAGFTMTFETYTEEGVYNRTASTPVKRSKFSGITNIDSYLTTPYALKTGNIPVEDANFKAYLVENFDTNGDSEISYEEANRITFISAHWVIESMQGIEYMERLESLYCQNNQLTSLDISNNAMLHHLDFSTNQLSSFSLSNNTALEELHCEYNPLTSLDLSNCTSLINLYCYEDRLASLDVSGCTALTTLQCGGNQLTSLVVTNNTALRQLSCSYNQLTSLDVSNNTALISLYCNNNQLTSLDVSNNTALISLYCYNNQLTGIDVSNNTALTWLNCYGNRLTSLDVSNSMALQQLHCGSNQLTSLDLSNNTVLTNLSCYSNPLTSLDVSNNTALKNLQCSDTPLTSLDVSNNLALEELKISKNQLTSLDVTNNTELKILVCDGNPLTSLDVSNNSALTNLDCHYDQLTSLDVSNNTALTNLCCYGNQLTSLDVSNNTALTNLYCYKNRLTSLNVSKNTVLRWLDCSPMEVDGVNLLETLYIYEGQDIPNVTIDRSDDCIPVETLILIATDNGGNESTGDEEVTP